MKIFAGLLCFISFTVLARGSDFLSSASRRSIIAPTPESYTVKSRNQAGNSAYRTVESRAYLPPARTITPISTRQLFSPFVTYTIIPQTYIPQRFFSTPVYTNQIASTPIYGNHFYPGYPGSVISHPIFANPTYPISSGPVISNPISPVGGGVPSVITNPVVGGGQVPAGGGISGDFPVQAPAPAAPNPVQGTVVDDDTVAIESA